MRSFLKGWSRDLVRALRILARAPGFAVVTVATLALGGRVTLLGVVIGIAAALGLTPVLGSLLFGVTPLDVPTFVGMSALMLALALLASYIPARRASAVDPMRALGTE